MIIILNLSIMFLVSVISLKLFKSLKVINVIFTYLWCSILILATFGLEGLDAPSIKVSLYCILFISVFNIAYITSFSSNKYRISKLVELNDTIRYRLIYILHIFSYIYMFPILLRAIHIARVYGYSAIRQYAFISSNMLVNGTQQFISQILINGIFIATSVIAMGKLAVTKKVEYITVFALIDIALYSIIFGGRFIIFEMILFYIVGYLGIARFRKKRKLTNGYKIVIIIVICGIIVMSELRGINNMFSSFYSYFVGPITFLNYIVKNPNTFELHHLLYGRALLGFITEPIVLLIKLFFTSTNNIHIASYYINTVTQVFYNISPGQSFNALTTAIYPFLRDFGVFGIILGGAFIGILLKMFECLALKKQSMIYYSLFIFMGYIALSTIILYNMMPYGVTFQLLFIIMFTKKGNKKNEN